MTTPLPPLRCTVRGCARPLARRATSLTCDGGHAFDLARSGHANLLQPQDRRSAHAGDARGHVEARARLFERGVGRALLERIAGFVPGPDSWLLEVGCGPGHALAELVQARGVRGVGLDLSAVAIERAARSFPELAWIVANADRGIPFLDASLRCVVSVAAPKPAREFRRVLAAGGRAIVAVPAADDLVELREAVLGEGRAQERAEKVIQSFGTAFELRERATVRERPTLERDELLDLLRASYRAARFAQARRAATLDRLRVTTSAEILVFEAR